MIIKWVKIFPVPSMWALSPAALNVCTVLNLCWGCFFVTVAPVVLFRGLILTFGFSNAKSVRYLFHAHLAKCRVGRTARLGERGDSLLFLQPVEIDYLDELKRHGVLLTEYPLLKLLDSMPFYGRNPNVKKFVSLETHHWVLSLQKPLESFVITEVRFPLPIHVLFSFNVCKIVVFFLL